MESTVHRIHIIGGPGSGKSTLARALGDQLGLPTFDLDTIAFEGKQFRERPAALRLTMVHVIAVQPRWVTEGIFLDWVDDLLRAADVIIWLDGVYWNQAAWRIIGRFVQFAWLETKRQRGVRKFARVQDYRMHLAQLIKVMFSSHSYYHSPLTQTNGNLRNVTRAATIDALAPFHDKVIRCRTRADIQTVLSMHGYITTAAPSFIPATHSNA